MLRQFNMDDQTYMFAEIRMCDATVTSCLKGQHLVQQSSLRSPNFNS